MHPYIDFADLHLPVYGLMGVFGFVISLIYVFITAKKRGISDDAPYIYVTGAICAMIGSKVLYLLVSLPDIADALNSGAPFKTVLLVFLRGGFVFYGGLLGAIIGAYAASKYFGHRLNEFLQCFAPAVALFHCFGRIGCHMAGCCYGIRTSSPFHVIFRVSEHAPNNVPLVPTQLTEAALLFVLFLILHFYAGRCKNNINMLRLYLLIYAPFRFIIEFVRGDAERGSLLIFSTSQWMSLIIIIVTVFLIFRSKIVSKIHDA